MNNIRYEFCQIAIEYLSAEKVHDMNLNRVTKGLSLEEAELLLITNHGNERLAFAGKQGWQIVSVVRTDPTDIGVLATYFMQRSSDHERFGRDFKTTYLDSELYKEHQRQINAAVDSSNKS